MHWTVCNYTLIYAHLNGTYQGWGVIATMNGIVYQPPWTFRPSCYARRLLIDTCLVSNKFYKSLLTNYDFGVAMGGLLLQLQNFKKVKLSFGHPVYMHKIQNNSLWKEKISYGGDTWCIGRTFEKLQNYACVWLISIFTINKPSYELFKLGP